MTENKRFHYRIDEVGIFYYICDGGKTEDKIFAEVLGDVEEVTDKLNELNEENKKLKLKKQELEISLLNNQLAYNSLMNENGELKKIIKEVKNDRE